MKTPKLSAIVSNDKVYSMQRCQRIYKADDEDGGGEDDELHRHTDAHEVAEAVAARGIDEHVGGRSDGY